MPKKDFCIVRSIIWTTVHRFYRNARTFTITVQHFRDHETVTIHFFASLYKIHLWKYTHTYFVSTCLFMDLFWMRVTTIPLWCIRLRRKPIVFELLSSLVNHFYRESNLGRTDIDSGAKIVSNTPYMSKRKSPEKNWSEKSAFPIPLFGRERNLLLWNADILIGRLLHWVMFNAIHVIFVC